MPNQRFALEWEFVNSLLAAVPELRPTWEEFQADEDEFLPIGSMYELARGMVTLAMRCVHEQDEEAREALARAYEVLDRGMSLNEDGPIPNLIRTTMCDWLGRESEDEALFEAIVHDMGPRVKYWLTLADGTMPFCARTQSAPRPVNVSVGTTRNESVGRAHTVGHNGDARIRRRFGPGQGGPTQDRRGSIHGGPTQGAAEQAPKDGFNHVDRRSTAPAQPGEQMPPRDIRPVLEVAWDFTLFRHHDDLFIEVVCGSVGLSTMAIQLSAAEVSDYETRGTDAIVALKDRIARCPKAYSDRHIGGFDTWPVADEPP